MDPEKSLTPEEVAKLKKKIAKFGAMTNEEYATRYGGRDREADLEEARSYLPESGWAPAFAHGLASGVGSEWLANKMMDVNYDDDPGDAPSISYGIGRVAGELGSLMTPGILLKMGLKAPMLAKLATSAIGPARLGLTKIGAIETAARAAHQGFKGYADAPEGEETKEALKGAIMGAVPAGWGAPSRLSRTARSAALGGLAGGAEGVVDEASSEAPDPSRIGKKAMAGALMAGILGAKFGPKTSRPQWSAIGLDDAVPGATPPTPPPTQRTIQEFLDFTGRGVTEHPAPRPGTLSAIPPDELEAGMVMQHEDSQKQQILATIRNLLKIHERDTQKGIPQKIHVLDETGAEVGVNPSKSQGAHTVYDFTQKVLKRLKEANLKGATKAWETPNGKHQVLYRDIPGLPGAPGMTAAFDHPDYGKIVLTGIMPDYSGVVFNNLDAQGNMIGNVMHHRFDDTGPAGLELKILQHITDPAQKQEVGHWFAKLKDLYKQEKDIPSIGENVGQSNLTSKEDQLLDALIAMVKQSYVRRP